MLVVIIGLGAATVFLVSGLVREARELGAGLARLGEVAIGEDEAMSAEGPTRRFSVERASPVGGQTGDTVWWTKDIASPSLPAAK